ncbi:MAG: ATP-binding protein [Desulfovibrio sp.]
MTLHTQKEHLSRLERRIENLAREKAAALKALELAASLGTFDTATRGCSKPNGVIHALTTRVGDLLDFSHAGVYLANEETNDFVLTHCRRPKSRSALEAETEALIRDHSFAWAMKQNAPAFFLASDRTHQILLHVLATRNRIRGMFVGLMTQKPEEIPDTTLALLSVVFSAAAHALENCELHNRLEEINRHLETRIEQRTQELQDANAQLNDIIQTVPAGIVLVDAETKCISDINASALKMLGLKREEILGHPCNERFCEGSHDCCPCLEGRPCTLGCDRIMRRPDGQTIHVMRSVVTVVLGGRRYLLDSFVDITEHRKLAKLREDVEQITRHDLKTPLNGIIALPDIILDRWNVEDAEARGMLRMIKDAGLRMLRMINLSHDLFKMETGKYHYTPVNMNLTPLFRSILMELEDLTLSRKIKMRILVNNKLLTKDSRFMIFGEELLVYSMLSNLIKNALEAAPHNSTVTLRLDGGLRTKISIHNLGVVPESIRKKFFDKFTTVGKIGGSGLGTYSARLITRTMGGDISFTTDEKEGTIVTVRLPGPHKIQASNS